MRKISFIIFSFLLFANSYAQQIQWGPDLKIKTYLLTDFNTETGSYLGNIDGSDYYAYYDQVIVKDQIWYNNIHFFESKSNLTTRWSGFIDKKYNFLDVSLSNNKISIVYLDGKKNDDKQIKLDLIDPATFKVVETRTLISIEPVSNNEPFIKVIRSENKEYIAFIIDAKDPDSNEEALLLYSFNNNFDEVWNSSYSLDIKGAINFSDAMISDSGKVLFQYLVYNKGKNAKLKSINYVEIDQQNQNEFVHELDPNFTLVESKIDKYVNNQYIIVYTSPEKIYAYKLEPTKGEILEIFNQRTYNGNWKIDKIIDLKNGNYTIALQNRDVTTITVVQSNGIRNDKYYSWNRSFLFIGFNSANDEINYNKTLGRKYFHMQNWNSKVLQLTIEPFYFVKDGNICVVYNTEKKTEDNVSNSKESPTYLSYYVARSTVSPITKMATINPDGKIKVKMLFASKEVKGTFISKFAYLNEDNDIIFAKSKKKKITFGKVNL